jgi:hypothetical protein
VSGKAISSYIKRSLSRRKMYVKKVRANGEGNTNDYLKKSYSRKREL